MYLVVPDVYATCFRLISVNLDGFERAVLLPSHCLFVNFGGSDTVMFVVEPLIK